ncbi:MAG: hemerythrin domain-containing protein [Candidatus Sulfotelmatobacter sp.]
MPVQIGAATHNFSDPTALLSDCHRRIEMFLGTLERMGAYLESPLGDDTRTALESALRYFRESAPKHTADEEESLFPRLRKSACAEVKAAVTRLDALEQDHRRGDSLHAAVDALGKRCLEKGSLSAVEADQFRRAVADLASIYTEHICIEDNEVFPIAGERLSDIEKAAIAVEMRDRRR